MRPSGTRDVERSPPGVETPGYGPVSLRDIRSKPGTLEMRRRADPGRLEMRGERTLAVRKRAAERRQCVAWGFSPR